VHIGTMDRRVSLVKKVKAVTTTGSETLTDQLVATVWAAREDVTGETVVEDKLVAVNTVIYHVRYNSAIAAENLLDLLLDDSGVRYTVLGSEMIGRKKYVKLKCQVRE